jgi:phosphoribosylformylglycinamidine synthase
MPHFERSIFPHNWGYYPAEKKQEVLSPWILAFRNAKEWVEEKM